MRKTTERSTDERGLDLRYLPMWLKVLLVGVAAPAYVIRVIDLFYPLHERAQHVTFIVFGTVVLIMIFFGGWAQRKGKFDD